MWQEVIVGLCVLAASVYMLRQWLPISTQKKTGCGGCGGCGTTKNCHNPTEKNQH